MKQLIAVWFSLVLLVACNTQSSQPSSNTGVLAISGTIQGWNSAFGSTIEATTLSQQIVGQGSVDTAGNFGIQLSPPTVFRPTPIGGCTQTLNPNVVVTPVTLRMNNVILQAGQAGGSARFITFGDAPSGRYVVSYLYANEAGSVSGTDRCTVAYFYNLNLQVGWNIVIGELVRNASGRPTDISYRSYPLNSDLSAYRYFAPGL